jgi:hypothetical protein
VERKASHIVYRTNKLYEELTRRDKIQGSSVDRYIDRIQNIAYSFK